VDEVGGVSGQAMLGGTGDGVDVGLGYGVGEIGVLILRLRERGGGEWIGARVFKGGSGWTISWLIWLMSNMEEAKVFFLFDFLEKDCWERSLFLLFLLFVVGIREAEIYDDDIRRRGGRLVPCKAAVRAPRKRHPSYSFHSTFI